MQQSNESEESDTLSRVGFGDSVRASLCVLSFFALLLIETRSASAQAVIQEGAPHSFLHFVRTEAARMRANDESPATLDSWEQQRSQIRAKLLDAWGGFPVEAASLEPRILATAMKDGYRVEKLIFQTLPGVWMTANAYVPLTEGKHPAVLCVHGHWPGAKQDPHVQSRCIGLAKLGFFVLAVDAMGAGERAIGKNLGEYHGEMVAATLWPIGRPLSGLQVYENMRAVDYLQTRSEVDADRLGITGASGGGNQTMYAGAWDERFKAVVPVCSVGNYQAYLGAACCMCEVVPGALSFTEEAGVLGLIAPRALMVISATRDAFQFSVGEARKSIAAVRPVFELYNANDKLQHAVFESSHDYNQPMREAMYGWMMLHLKREGVGTPVSEPPMQLEDPESLRCFPGTSRPDDWITLPQFAAQEARRINEEKKLPTSAVEWQLKSAQQKTQLDTLVLGGTSPERVTVSPKNGTSPDRFPEVRPESGIQLRLETSAKNSESRTEVILLTLSDKPGAEFRAVTKALEQSKHLLVNIDLRATKSQALQNDRIGRAPDHNTGEWSLWLGRPLLGQWVKDVRAALNALEEFGHGGGTDVVILAEGPAGLVAICAAALDDRIKHVVTVGSLASFVSDMPYVGQHLGTMPNGIVRDVGDIADIAALIAPRKLTVVASVNGQNESLDEPTLQAAYSDTRRMFRLSNADDNLQISASVDVGEILDAID